MTVKNWKRTAVSFMLCLSLIISMFALGACGGGGEESETESETVEIVETSTEGLEYNTLSDGTLEVVGYAGPAGEVVIDTHEGKDITAIADTAFAGKTSITAIKLGASVKKIGVAAFADCTSLVSVDAGASALTSIGNAAFLGCSALKSFTAPMTLKNIGVDAFLACDAFESLSYLGSGDSWTKVMIGDHNEVLDEKIVLAGGEAYAGVLAEGNCSSVVSWVLDKTGVLTIKGEGHMPDYDYNDIPWKEYADEITSVVVADGIDIIGKNAFNGMDELISVTLAESVRLIDNNAFQNCTALETVTLPSNLRRIGSGAFYRCSSLTAIVIPDTVTHIGGGAFMDCSRLAEATVSANIEGIEEWTFANCVKLGKITLSEKVIDIGSGAFYNCTAMTEITMGGADTINVGANAFRDSGLKTVNYTGDKDIDDVFHIENGNKVFEQAEFVMP